MAAEKAQFEAAVGIIRSLKAAGYEAYLAGGCVRDLLLGRNPSDYDVATSATPDAVLAMFERTFAVGAHFGVVLVATCAGAHGACAPEESAAEESHVVIEVATFRHDGAYSDGRHPDAVRYTLSAEEDVKRRDFTINGLLLNPDRLSFWGDESENPPRVSGPATEKFTQARDTGFSPYITPARISGALAPGGIPHASVLDFVGGIADLEAGLVRAIGDAHLRFEEDHLRMLRAVRFAARFHFAIDPQTTRAIRALAPKAAAVSRERVRDELTRMLTEGHARRAFELLDETGLLQEVLPEVARMKGVEQPPQYHPEGDVWVHTLGLLVQLEAGASPTLAWGALLHDVGKPATFRRAPDRIRFDGHVDVGIAIAAQILGRFRFSNEETQQILALVENHMRFADAERMKASTLKRFFRLQKFEEHLALHRMDCMAASGNLDHWHFVDERWRTMPEEVMRPAPLLTGRDLIAAGYQPGPAFKEMLRAVEDAQLEGAIATAGEAIALIQSRFPNL